MVLIEPIKYGLELVQKYNGLERSQLAFLMRKRYVNRNPDMDIDKLLRMNLVIEQKDSIFAINQKVCVDIREAMRVMLVLWNSKGVYFDKGDYPVLLTFIKSSEKSTHRYVVCWANNANDNRLYKYENSDCTIIFVTQNKELSCGFSNYICAVKENGTYKFYKNNEEVKRNEL